MTSCLINLLQFVAGWGSGILDKFGISDFLNLLGALHLAIYDRIPPLECYHVILSH